MLRKFEKYGAPILLLLAACGGDGEDGASALVSVSTEDPGANCADGGLRVDTGLDDGAGGETAADGVLGAGEITATEYVCHGGEGTAASQALISVTDEPVGGNCAAGGQRIDVGLDDGDGDGTAGNGTLEPGEIDQTRYLCAALAPWWPAGDGILRNQSLVALELEGWTICHQDTYDQILDEAGVIDGCQGDYMMLACREGSSDTLTLAAADHRDVVIEEDAADLTSHHVAGSVAWYYSPEASWGFFQAGGPVNRNPCDTGGENGDRRLCWHTTNNGGYRCGQTIDLNADDSWERLVLVK